jgi:hypothetical protein
VAVISDFYDPADQVMKALRPLSSRRHDLVLFHVLDPAERHPDLRDPVLLDDMETGDRMQVGPREGREYERRLQEHIDALRRASGTIGADYQLLDTSRPLDGALREYLRRRERRGT